MTDQPRDQALGKYGILEELGRGGFATVYRARDPDLDRDVALKVLDPLLTRDPVWVARFRREARAVARLDHPHVVTIYEVGQAEGMLYIAARLVEGGNLADRIREGGPLPWDEVVRLAGQIASALDYAHDQGVVHRDLKSANVLLDEERGAQLTDFGFASVVSESSYSVSVSGGVVGTPQYIAPEIWEGQPATAQTDIYALGCILYEMVTGEHLFQGDTTPSVMRAHFQPLALPESWPEGVPPGLGEVLHRALAKEPAERYERAQELADSVAALREDRLAEPYAALEAAVAASEWERALKLAQQIQSEDPDYGDVVTLEETALAGLEQDARTREAVAWKCEAEHALAEGDLRGAERALRQWETLVPGDAKAQAFRSELAMASNPLPVSDSAEVPSTGMRESLRVPSPPSSTSMPELEPTAPQRVRERPSRPVPGWLWILGALAAITLIVGWVILSTRPAPQAPVILDEVTPSGPTATPLPATPSMILSASEAQATLSALGVDGCSAYEDAEDFEGAAECLRLVTIAEPANFWAYDNLARVYQILDEWELALQADQQGLEVAKTPEDQVEAYLGMGVTYYRMADYQSAIDSLLTAAGIDQSVPANDTNVQVWLAWSYRENGEMPEACAHFQEALNLAEQQDYTWAINHAQEGLEQCKATGVSAESQPELIGTPTPGPSRSISADTTRLGFLSDRDGSNEIYVMNPDGSNIERLTNNALREISPACSPDGRYIAFWARQNDEGEIYRIHVDGSGLTQLTHDETRDDDPSWSPDSSSIVYSHFGQIRIMKADGSESIAVSDELANNGPAWSPDGTRIAFYSSRTSNSLEVYAMNVDGSQIIQLTDSAAVDHSPEWSPDSRQIAFESYRTGNYEIYVMNRDGSSETNLTENRAWDANAAWSPDGQYIAFASDRDGNWEIYIMRADGTEVTRLTRNSAYDGSPFWLP